MQSSRWQRVAQVPTRVINDHATRCDLAGDELTTAGLLRYFNGTWATFSVSPVLASVPLLASVV